MDEPIREQRGRLVRETWVRWAREQPDPKDSWLTPWDDLDEGQREVDMRIEAAVRADERERIRKELAADQMADHAPIESIYGLCCRTCVGWLDAPMADGSETEFGIAIPAPWPCRVVRALEVQA